MNHRLRLLALLGVLLAGAYVHAQFGDAPAKLNVVKIADDLFVIHNEFVPGNTTALVTTDGVILVDDKFEVDHATILAQLKTVTNQPVKYVINTHHHADHSGGNAKLQALNVQVVASRQARDNMVQAKQPGQPNMTFDGHASIHLGGKRVELYQFGRAHTNGDAVVLFPQQRTLAAGDMFTLGDSTPQLVDYPGGGSAKEWTATLDGVLKLDFDRVVPGHGNVTTKAEMRKFRESTVRLKTRIHDMVAGKKTRADIEKMVRKDFHFADLHVERSLDGLINELK
jgi:glyoxylase-like metal-dependent hydrolase (beta-lactamase superfamily II)